MIEAKPTKAVPDFAMRDVLTLREQFHASGRAPIQPYARAPVFFVDPQSILDIAAAQIYADQEDIRLPYNRFLLCLIYNDYTVIYTVGRAVHERTYAEMADRHAIRVFSSFENRKPISVPTTYFVDGANWLDPYANDDGNSGTYHQSLRGLTQSERAMHAMLAIFLAHLLNGTTSDTAPPPRDKARLTAKGIQGWTFKVVELPKPTPAPSPPLGGTHAPPRWHERRGHWRQLRTGKRVWVRNCEVGDKSRGGVIHDYAVTPYHRPPGAL